MNDDTSFIGLLRSRLACATDADRRYERPMNWEEADRLLVAFDAALEKARNDALEEAAKWHDKCCRENAEASAHVAEDRDDKDRMTFHRVAEWHALQAAAIRAMRIEPFAGREMPAIPVAGHEGPAVTHKGEAPDTIAIPRKLLTEAHAVMRAHGWQLAPASATSEDGVIEAAAAEIEGRFAELLGAREP